MALVEWEAEMFQEEGDRMMTRETEDLIPSRLYPSFKRPPKFHNCSNHCFQKQDPLQVSIQRVTLFLTFSHFSYRNNNPILCLTLWVLLNKRFKHLSCARHWGRPSGTKMNKTNPCPRSFRGWYWRVTHKPVTSDYHVTGDRQAWEAFLGWLLSVLARWRKMEKSQQSGWRGQRQGGTTTGWHTDSMTACNLRQGCQEMKQERGGGQAMGRCVG